MANKSIKVEKPVQPNPQRIHFKQFIAMHPELDDMQKSGLKAFCGGIDWMYETEWNDKLSKAYGNQEKEVKKHE